MEDEKAIQKLLDEKLQRVELRTEEIAAILRGLAREGRLMVCDHQTGMMKAVASAGSNSFGITLFVD